MLLILVLNKMMLKLNNFNVLILINEKIRLCNFISECNIGHNDYNFYNRKGGCIDFCFYYCERGALTTTTPGVDLTIQHPRQIPIGNRNFPPYINKFLTTFELE